MTSRPDRPDQVASTPQSRLMTRALRVTITQFLFKFLVRTTYGEQAAALSSFPGIRMFTVAFAAGCLLSLQWPVLPEIPVWLVPGGWLWYASIAGTGCGFAFLYRWLPVLIRPAGWRGPVFVWRLMLALAAGALWTLLTAHQHLASRLPPALEGQIVTLTGVIDDLVETGTAPWGQQRSARFTLRVDGGDAGPVRRVRLSVYEAAGKSRQKQGQGTAASWPAQPLLPGERWTLRAKLKRPHDLANFYAPHPEFRAFLQRIDATGAVVQGKGAAALTKAIRQDMGLHGDIQRWRHNTRERLSRLVPDPARRALLAALIIGDTSGVRPSQWQVLRATGTSHLFAISGLHVGLVAGLIAWLASLLWRRGWPATGTGIALVERIPAPRIAAFAAVLAAGGYLLLAGAGLPVQRAFIMVCVVACAFVGRVRALPSQALALALLVILLWQPFALLAPGLWLSFGAVAILMTLLYAPKPIVAGRLVTSGWAVLRHKIGMAIRAQWAITIGLIPLLILAFGEVSLISPVANAFAIPVMSMLITPLALCGVLLPDSAAQLVWHIAATALHECMSVLGMLGSMSWAVWYTVTPPLWIVLLAATGTICWLLSSRLRQHVHLSRYVLWALLALSWLPYWLFSPQRPPVGQWHATALDIGQGTAVLIRTRHHALLFDSGPVQFAASNRPESERIYADAGHQIIVPFLRKSGINRLDRMVISHADADHVGGALSVMRGVQVDAIASSLDQFHPVVKGASRHEACLQGDSWEWDGVPFTFLFPDQGAYRYNASLKRRSGKSHNNEISCVLKVGSGRNSILLTGDIELAQEYQLVRQSEQLASSVLMAPHHGSKTSSGAAFLDAVGPDHAFFQAGHRNRYGHPNRDVLQRYRDRAIHIWRTDQCGAVEFWSRPDQAIGTRSFRVAQQRFWYDQQAWCVGSGV